jgi:methylphosphotriester-DNA--protein-cysteine methyltransferase
MNRYVPRPPLSGLVDFFWSYEAYGAGHARERVLPGPVSELVVVLNGARAGTVFCGAQSESFVIETADRPALLGVHFKAGGAFPFLRRMPADELHNVQVSLDAIWGADARDLQERLQEAATPAARFRLLEAALLARRGGPAVRHPAVAYALAAIDARPSRPIREITDRIGLSARRFIEIFSTEVGLTPKLYGRVRRFQAVLTRVHGAADVDWTDVALTCGYYDQAHFIHDFRAFSGLSPTAYLRAGVRDWGHVPLEE